MRLNSKIVGWIVSVLAVVVLAFGLGCDGGGGGGRTFLGYTISGKVISASDNTGLSEMKVLLSDASGSDTTLLHSTTTDSTGSYFFSGLNNGKYSVSVVPTDSYSFNPISQNVEVSSSDVTGINFSGYLPLSGETTTQNIGPSGGTISTQGGATATFDSDFLTNTAPITISTYPSDLATDEGITSSSNVIRITIPHNAFGSLSTKELKISEEKSTLEQEPASYLTITLPSNSTEGKDWRVIGGIISSGYKSSCVEALGPSDGPIKIQLSRELRDIFSSSTYADSTEPIADNYYFFIEERTPIHVNSSLWFVNNSNIQNSQEVWNESKGVISPYPANKPVIILIHGWQGGTAASKLKHEDVPALEPHKEGWKWFADYFYNHSFKYNGEEKHLSDFFDLFTYRYDTDEDINYVAAENLFNAINTVFDNNVEIYIIGHSMGGLVGQQLIYNHQDLAGNRIKKLITLSTPFHGSPLVQKFWNFTNANTEVPFVAEVVPFVSIDSVGFRELAWDGFDRNPKVPAVDLSEWVNKIYREPVSNIYFPFAAEFAGGEHKWYYKCSRPILDGMGYAENDGNDGGNDGMVPVYSSWFADYDVQTGKYKPKPALGSFGQPFSDYDHSQIETGKDGSSTAVFDEIKEILLPSQSQCKIKVIDQCNNPVSGAYVILHNDDGTVKDYKTTGNDGIAALGNIGQDRITFTVACVEDSYGTHTGYSLMSGIGVPYLKDKENIIKVWRKTGKKGTINVSTNPTGGEIILGEEGLVTCWGSFSSGSIDIYPENLQSDGKISLGGFNSTNYGFLLDQNFQDGGNYTVNLDKQLQEVSFTSNIPIEQISATAYRKNMSYPIGYGGYFGQTSGSFSVAKDIPDAVYWISAGTGGYDSSTNIDTWIYVEKKYSSLPNSLSINMPNLSVDSINYNGQNVSWTIGGTTEKDSTTIELTFGDVNSYSWTDWDIEVNPSTTSWDITKLKLPQEIEGWLFNYHLESVFVEVYNYDTVHGFDNLVQTYLENPDFPQFNEEDFAQRGLYITSSGGVGEVNPLTKGLNKNVFRPREKYKKFPF